MVTVPVATPVITPALLTVAIVVLDEVQGLTAAGVPEPVRVIVPPLQTAVGPVIVGLGVTVMLSVLLQPAEFV